MNSLNLVSIIIPTYNRSSYLIQTLFSILKQTYQNFEIIIVDDGSIDETENEIADLSDKIKYHKLKRVGNLSTLRNYGINHSNGEFIAFCDDDDLWEENKLEVQMTFLKQYEIVCSNARIVNENDKVIRLKYFEEVQSDFDIDLAVLVRNNYVITSSVILKKRIMNDELIFNDKITHRGEDYSAWLGLTKYYKIRFVNKSLIRYRLHINNLSFLNEGERIDLLKNTITIRSAYWKSQDAIIRGNSMKGCVSIYRELLIIYYNRKDYPNILLYCRKLFALSRHIRIKSLLKYSMIYFYTILRKSFSL